MTQVMADRAWVWITLGVITLVGVWFVGDTRRAGQARAAAQPILENRWVSYAIATGSLLVLALIAPLFRPRLGDLAGHTCSRHRRHRSGQKHRPTGSSTDNEQLTVYSSPRQRLGGVPADDKVVALEARRDTRCGVRWVGAGQPAL